MVDFFYWGENKSHVDDAVMQCFYFADAQLDTFLIAYYLLNCLEFSGAGQTMV